MGCSGFGTIRVILSLFRYFGYIVHIALIWYNQAMHIYIAYNSAIIFKRGRAYVVYRFIQEAKAEELF